MRRKFRCEMSYLQFKVDGYRVIVKLEDTLETYMYKNKSVLKSYVIFSIHCLRIFDTDLKMKLSFFQSSIIRQLHTQLYLKIAEIAKVF